MLKDLKHVSNIYILYANQVKLPSLRIKFNLPTRGTRDDYIYEGTFHEAVGSILAVAQMFGLMPVNGIKAKKPSQLRFTKFSFRFLLCVFYIIGMTVTLCLTVHWIATTRLEFGKLINFTFEFTNMLSVLCFLELARKWPQLMVTWYKVEKFLPQLKYQFDKQKMAYQIKMASLTILFSSMSKFWIFFCQKKHNDWSD